MSEPHMVGPIEQRHSLLDGSHHMGTTYNVFSKRLLCNSYLNFISLITQHDYFYRNDYDDASS